MYALIIPRLIFTVADSPESLRRTPHHQGRPRIAQDLPCTVVPLSLSLSLSLSRPSLCLYVSPSLFRSFSVLPLTFLSLSSAPSHSLRCYLLLPARLLPSRVSPSLPLLSLFILTIPLPSSSPLPSPPSAAPLPLLPTPPLPLPHPLVYPPLLQPPQLPNGNSPDWQLTSSPCTILMLTQALCSMTSRWAVATWRRTAARQPWRLMTWTHRGRSTRQEDSCVIVR